jgi:hypothetical protein
VVTKLSGPTFFAGVFVLFVACGIAIRNAFNQRYPWLPPFECPDCDKTLRSRNPITLNQAKDEHLTEHARQNAGRN